ncbi:MAG: xanthine dehydrogenase family protein molybdopterin-binding subunit [Chloroflexi bacterium]|nr:xanthine dehydrogenase family protein molybdopterin-binding subunit [Chloroflexota bacterium]
MIPEQTKVISESIKRIDAHGKVTGEALYPGDINIEGQLWLRVKFSERAHARVLRVDASKAEALPGVARVFTSLDVPINEYGLVLKDQPVLCGPGGGKAGTDVARCYMDMVATVVAETDAIAQEALDLIDVQYEDLPAVFDPEEAMAEAAPQLHPDSPRNLVTRYRIRRGDMEAGWAAAEIVVEGEYETTWQEHAYLQPEAGLAYIDEEDRVTVLVAGQWTHEDQEQIYHALALPPEQVRVIYPAIGGAFGGREDMTVQIVLALAAWQLRVPIKIQWNREESILYHHKRHPIKVRAKWGASANGLLTAAAAEVIGDAGAYNYTSNKVLGNAQLTVTGPYEIPNVHVDTFTVYTNNIPSGAFRGFGAPQALFAAEGQVNRLAAALKLDPLEIRLKNSIREGSIGSVDTPFPAGVTMPQVFEACGRESWWGRSAAGWRLRAASQPADQHRRRGRGIAGGFKNVGFSFGFPEHCWAGIELRGSAEIEKVILYHAGADVGQGAHTALSQMAAEAVGMPFETVEIVASDTASSESAGSASASRLTFMSGNAIRGAAEIALRKWQDEERPALGEFMYHPPATTAFDPETGRAEPNFAYGYVAEAVEVEVDIETGQVRLLEVVCANDVGKVINPQQLQGQIEGAIVQAQGYALMEYLVSDEGRILNPYLSTYLIPTSLDVPPRIKSVILENPDPIGPWGARGMAEMPFLPLAPAIAAAIYDAAGIWIDSQPFTAQKVLQALRQRGIGAI